MRTWTHARNRVGDWTITTTIGRTDDFVGIGARWSAQVDGHVTVLVGLASRGWTITRVAP